MEALALRRSIFATAGLGLLGVVWGILAGSQVILLDGVYGIIGIATSWLLLRASALAAERPSGAYPFGREAMTPFAIGVQGAVQLATLAYAALEAVYVIRHGGSLVAAGPAILYSAIATVSCVIVWQWLRRHEAGSEILVSEAIAWRLAAVRGIAMLLGFGLLLAVTGTAFEPIGPYLDPILVLVTVVLLVGPPVRLVRQALHELLERRPDAPIVAEVQAGVASVAEAHGVDASRVRVAKVGRKVYVEVEASAAPTVTIAEEHRARRALEGELGRRLAYDVWLTFELFPAEEQPA